MGERGSYPYIGFDKGYQRPGCSPRERVRTCTRVPVRTTGTYYVISTRVRTRYVYVPLAHTTLLVLGYVHVMCTCNNNKDKGVLP
jgi:hypothetical protein